MIRNLVYFVYPKAESIWEWNVEQLYPRLSVFNGKRLIIVATDETTVDKELVISKFKGGETELVFVKNDQETHETVHFMEVLKRIASTSSDEATFYAHAKGVSRNGPAIGNIKEWVKTMLFLNLEHIPLIEKAFNTYSAVGCFAQDMHHWGSSWHYSGTFFWFKHSAIFSKNWQEIARNIWGVEAYLGRHLPKEEALNLTESSRLHFSELYCGKLLDDSDRYRWLYQMRNRFEI